MSFFFRLLHDLLLLLRLTQETTDRNNVFLMNGNKSETRANENYLSSLWLVPQKSIQKREKIPKKIRIAMRVGKEMSQAKTTL